MNRILSALLVLTGLPLAAAPVPPERAHSPELRRFENCQELETYLEDLAIENVRRNAENWRRWQYHYRNRGGLPFGGRGAAAPSAAPAPAASAGGAVADKAEPGPSAYTQTNTQVGGVDEADFVKTDGRHLYVLAQGALQVVKSWPAEELDHSARVAIEGQPQEMFLGEDGRVVVFSRVPFQRQSPEDDDRGSRRVRRPVRVYHHNGVKVTVVDTSTPSRPRVVSEVFLSGYYNTARRIGSSVRVVLADYFHWAHAYPYGYRGWDPEERSIDAWLKREEKSIRQSSLDDLLPTGERRVGGEREALPVSCEDVFRPKGVVRAGALSVVTFDLYDPAKVHRTVLLTQPGQVYASTESLYVASPQWWWNWAPGQSERTFIHKLDLSDPNRARYVASGVIEGHLLNQFSMDEHRGYLRLATTQTRFGRDDRSPWSNATTVNKVRVLATHGERLRVVGQTEDLAKGERIYSARFFGEKGYVVTFRQVDPLFTLDLSDPTEPRVVGELKIPGFSTYIHPMDDDHLLTIGVHVPEGSNRREGMKISVFDVSDMANPKEAFTHVIAGSSSWSESVYNHKAFNYFAQKRLLAVPVYHYMGNGYSSDLKVFRIHPKYGIRAKGTLAMSDLKLANHGYGYVPPVRRSVMADDFVYAISDAGVRVAEIGALEDPIATVSFSTASVVSAR